MKFQQCETCIQYDDGICLMHLEEVKADNTICDFYEKAREKEEVKHD